MQATFSEHRLCFTSNRLVGMSTVTCQVATIPHTLSLTCFTYHQKRLEHSKFATRTEWMKWLTGWKRKRCLPPVGWQNLISEGGESEESDAFRQKHTWIFWRVPPLSSFFQKVLLDLSVTREDKGKPYTAKKHWHRHAQIASNLGCWLNTNADIDIIIRISE